MADKAPNFERNGMQNEGIAVDPKIAESVIDEYDVIEDKETKSSNKSDLRSQMPAAMSGDEVDESTSGSHVKRLSSSDRTNTVEHEQMIQCPKVNCQEKIILCVDASAEMEKLTFRSRAGDKLSPKELTKRAIGIFLQGKNRIDKKHEFALILLNETAVWVRDFSNNPRDIRVALEDVVDTNYCESCDIGSVFDKIVDKVDLPTVEGDPAYIPPPYVIRVIFIYSRSNCPLQFEKKESYNLLNSSPYFFLDAVYLHEPPNEANQCQVVFDTICDLDNKGTSYIVGASRNQTKFYDHMAQLLAHPLQRPAQNDTAYRIGSSIPENG